MAARRFLTSDTTAPPPTTTADAPPAAPHVRWGMHGTAVKVAIAGNVVVVVLFFVAIVWRIYFSGKDHDGGGGAAAAAPLAQGADGAVAARASSSGASTPCASLRAGGLRREELLALPVFVHGSSAAEEEAGKVECAVCIGELRDGDAGRLLPRCGHRFHAECVDRWLRSHVTCPLCRAVVADGGSGRPDTKVLPAV